MTAGRPLRAESSPLPAGTRARVVVIGGGVIGCSVAYNLTRLGWSDVLVLERGRLTCGTTWHAAGVVGQLGSHDTLTSLKLQSVALYQQLAGETGQDTGWRQCGALWVASTRERLIQLRRAVASATAQGIEASMISPAEAAQSWPLLRHDDLTGAAWFPGDGRVNPTDVTQALARGARAGGARIAEGVTVRGISVLDGAVRSVTTDEAGQIECDIVVNCAGQWSKMVGAMAGVTVPLHSAGHFYVVTEPIEGVVSGLATLRDPDGYIYAKEEVLGLAVGGFEPSAKPWASPDAIPEPFEFSLLGEDWDQYRILLENAAYRIPAFEKSGITTFINGPESFTPDHNFIMGEAPEVRNFYVACGFNSAGIGYAGGVGGVLAEWIVSGAAPCDLSAVDIRRFAPFHGNTRWLRERVQEAVGLHMAMPWPNREFETARPLRRSPVHDRLAAEGASFGSKMGWERANWFGSSPDPDTTYSWARQNWFDAAAAEHKAARETCALFDVTSFSKYILKGRDAEPVLEYLCTNMVAVPPGRIVYTGMLNDRAGYESDLTVTRIAEREFLISTGSGQLVRDFSYIERAIPGDAHAEIVDVTSGYAAFALMGPHSRALLQSVSPQSFGNEAFPFGTSRVVSIGLATCRATRISSVGELGWELWVPAEFAVTVFDTLRAAGSRHGLLLGGYYALESLRLEKAYRALGPELTPDYTPLEAGLMFACKLKSGIPFRGREALEAQLAGGVRRMLVSLVLTEPDAVLWGGELVLREGKPAGFTTSGAYGHTLGASVGLAYIERSDGDAISEAWLQQGRYEVEVSGQVCDATLHVRPPYDPDSSRVRGLKCHR